MVTDFCVNKMCKATFTDDNGSHVISIMSDDDLFIERAIKVTVDNGLFNAIFKSDVFYNTISFGCGCVTATNRYDSYVSVFKNRLSFVNDNGTIELNISKLDFDRLRDMVRNCC